jgi:hypothetical protein
MSMKYRARGSLKSVYTCGQVPVKLATNDVAARLIICQTKSTFCEAWHS